MSTLYEWDVETVADGDTADLEDGEVIEHRHCASFREAMAYVARDPAPAGCKYLVVLVRDDDDRRSWAYVDEHGALPEYSSDADGRDYRRVPRRFHVEVRA